MLTTEYYKYCLQNGLYIHVEELSNEITYYWHPYFSLDTYFVTFEKISGNTYIFKSNKNTIGLSAHSKFILGLSINYTVNTFDFKKYVEE